MQNETKSTSNSKLQGILKFAQLIKSIVKQIFKGTNKKHIRLSINLCETILNFEVFIEIMIVSSNTLI